MREKERKESSKIMKLIEIPEDLHYLIQAYCVFNRCKIKDFTTKAFQDNKDLITFKLKLKEIQFS